MKTHLWEISVILHNMNTNIDYFTSKNYSFGAPCDNEDDDVKDKKEGGKGMKEGAKGVKGVKGAKGTTKNRNKQVQCKECFKTMRGDHLKRHMKVHAS